MRLLVVCLHYPMCLGRRLVEAFEAIGVDVRHIGPEYRNGISGINHAEPPKYPWETMGDWQHYWTDWIPDVVLYAETFNDEWRHDFYAARPHIHYNTAGPMDHPMPGMAHTFTAVSWGDIWKRTGSVSWLPCAYSSTECKPSRIPWAERKYDIALVGRMDEPRQRLLQELTAAGLTCFSASGLLFDEYVEVYHQARIALIQTHLHTMPCRLFEGAALGCLPLSPVYPEYGLLNVEGVMPFDEDERGSVVAAARFVLDHPSWSLDMIRKARRWVKAHTWQDRARKIVEWWENEKNNVVVPANVEVRHEQHVSHDGHQHSF